MFIFSRKHFQFRTPAGIVDVPAKFAGTVPDEVKNDWLFNAAVKSGDISLSEKKVESKTDGGKKSKKPDTDGAPNEGKTTDKE